MAMRPHDWHVACMRISSFFPNSLWHTGLTISMWPKCPGHLFMVFPQVLHLRPGLMTPRWLSIRPPSIGEPSLSYVSGLFISIADIFLICSGESILNSTALILLSIIFHHNPKIKILSLHLVRQYQFRVNPERLQLIKQELEPVAHLHGINLGVIDLEHALGLPNLILKPDDAGGLRNPHRHLVRIINELLLQEHRGAVADERFAFHLPEPEAALLLLAFSRLPGEYLHRAPRPGLYLVRGHVE